MCPRRSAAGRHRRRVRRRAPVGLGMRVPMIVVSPWSVGGYVCSEMFDHTSIVRFLETWLGIKAPELGDWRRTVFGDLTSAFDFAAPAMPPGGPSRHRTSRPRPTRDRHPPLVPGGPVRTTDARPGAGRTAGPAAAVPAGRLGAGARPVVEITMSNAGRQRAPRPVRLPGRSGEPLHLDVLGTAREVVYFPCPTYDLVLTGPNGLRREFAGTGRGAAAAVQDRHADRRRAAGAPSGPSPWSTTARTDPHLHPQTTRGR